MRKGTLAMALSALGIDIDAEEIQRKYTEAKDIMPKLAAFVNTLDARLSAIEERLGLPNGSASATDRNHSADSSEQRRIAG